MSMGEALTPSWPWQPPRPTVTPQFMRQVGHYDSPESNDGSCSPQTTKWHSTGPLGHFQDWLPCSIDYLSFLLCLLTGYLPCSRPMGDGSLQVHALNHFSKWNVAMSGFILTGTPVRGLLSGFLLADASLLLLYSFKPAPNEEIKLRPRKSP